MPLNAEEMAADAYVVGISCPHCIDQTSPRQRARFAERARQIELAKTRGTEHLGPARPHKKEEKSK